MSKCIFLYSSNPSKELQQHISGYFPHVYLVHSLKDAEKLAQVNPPNLIVIDIESDADQSNALEACQFFKKNIVFNHVLVAFLSPFTDDYIQINSFAAGVDDYISKPIRTKLLLYKLKALLKLPKDGEDEAQPIKISKQLEINTERYSIFKNNIEIILPRKEFEIVCLLSSKPGKVFSREEIIREIWKNEYTKNGRTIDVHIRKIREKLGDDSIKTIKGVGYKTEELRTEDVHRNH